MITVDDESALPPYEQIRSQVAAQIISGELDGGHRLPSIRQLAGDLRVAPGTVARAYAELESAGLIETGRAIGSRVRRGAHAGVDLPGAADRFVRAALRAGISEADAVGLVHAAWARATAVTR